jgi:predicted ATP-dependent serine protease
VVDWDSKEYDLEGRIHREITRGVMTGIPGLDDQDGFYGFQPGSMTCYLGRAKAGKTSFALLSAMRAWEDGKKVLFLTFEIAAGKLPSEPGVADRLDCFGSGIDLLHYMQGELTREEQDKLREFRSTCTDEAFRIVQPIGKYTVDDLEAEVDRYEPDVVYIDGFYFMTDRETGKSGGQWEGHDNLANDLKLLAMGHMVPVVISHQVREKQLTGKKGAGIDDGAMMGGTAIIMFADLVLGVDANEEGLRTLSCTRSRLQYLKTIHGTWNWSTCEFTEQEAPVDEDQYAYGKDKDDSDAPR